MKPLLELVGIVKDEAFNIRSTLESVKPWIDRFTILDTGSTDGTQAIVREVMAGVPGALYEEPFVDFAVSRNRALELAGDAATFTLSLSADELFVADATFRQYLEEKRSAADGAYCIQMKDSLKSWIYTRVLRSSAGWKYVGDPHEVPEGPNKERSGPTVPGVSITFLGSDPARKFKRLREYDLPRLEKRVFDNADIDDQDQLAQAIWFLGQTHELLAEEHPPRVPGGPWVQHKLAAMSLYLRRAELGEDKIFSSYAWLCGIKLASQLNLYTHNEMLSRLKVIVEMNPRSPEARYLTAVHAASLDPSRGLVLAEEAANVAKKAREAQADRDQTFYLPTDSRMEWLCLRIAADCAAATKRAPRAKQLAERAILVGGPREAFAEHLGS